MLQESDHVERKAESIDNTKFHEAFDEQFPSSVCASLYAPLHLNILVPGIDCKGSGVSREHHLLLVFQISTTMKGLGFRDVQIPQGY